MTNLLKTFLFVTLFTLAQTFQWLGTSSIESCGRIPASLQCSSNAFGDLEEIAAEVPDNEQLYLSMKEEFLSSPMCEADKVLNDPSQRVSPILFAKAMKDLGFITQSSSNRIQKIELFKNFVEKYQLDDEFKRYGLDLLGNYQDTASGRFMVMSRLRGSAVQQMDELGKSIPSYMAGDLKEDLADRGIFTRDEKDKASCPFISREAFMMAIKGREKLLKVNALKSKISKKDQLTVIDYSLPSNQRRMFVMDLKSGKVLHNTWSSHGRGNTGAENEGVDGLGSSPKMSNANGSNLSSEGFVIATTASTGNMYGPNVILDGVDLNNNKMKSRAIVLHGFRTPYHEYVTGQWLYNEAETKRILPAPDMYPGFLKTDFKTASEDEMDLAVDELRTSTNDDKYIDGTNGCVGVPESNARHLDRKGRNKSQLELLREDLPGSLILNYSGPEMKSKFF